MAVASNASSKDTSELLLSMSCFGLLLLILAVKREPFLSLDRQWFKRKFTFGSENLCFLTICWRQREEEIQGTLLGLFAGLAILIACMGLFGLASFTIVRRTKEIGIRKVMGASPYEIVMLLIMQFSRPVLIANVLAWPICWYAMNEWLTGFEFRIDLLPWFVAATAVAAFITVSLAWSTVAAHAVKVARTSPVFALRYE